MPVKVYLHCMSDQELITYFENKQLPENLRIDRATTQLEVVAAVKRNIAVMLAQPKDGGARHRLARIVYAIENPYSGPPLPNL